MLKDLPDPDSLNYPKCPIHPPCPIHANSPNDPNDPDPTPKSTAPKIRIIWGDVRQQLDLLRAGQEKFDLIVADPPYNQGVDYGQGPQADNLSSEAYMEWCRDWIDRATMDLLSDEGSMWIVTPWQKATMFTTLGRSAGLILRNVIIWHETFGQYAQNNFGYCHRQLLYFTRSLKQFTFNTGAIRIRSARLANGDKRANPLGKIPGNVWEIPRIVGNAAERIKNFPTQLPLAIIRPIVNACTNPGDRVLDPFVGSGTTGVEAVAALCDFTGIDLNEKYVDVARARIGQVLERSG